jgi:hypothetical protein
MHNIGNTLRRLGRKEQALAAARDAVQVRQRLATANPAVFEADLASSLQLLGVMLWSLGQRKPALTVATQSEQIYRKLAKANPAAFKHKHAQLRELVKKLR